jgi:hypothetical protein
MLKVLNGDGKLEAVRALSRNKIDGFVVGYNLEVPGATGWLFEHDNGLAVEALASLAGLELGHGGYPSLPVCVGSA